MLNFNEYSQLKSFPYLQAYLLEIFVSMRKLLNMCAMHNSNLPYSSGGFLLSVAHKHGSIQAGGSWFRVLGLGFRRSGFRFRVQGLGFRV